MKTLGLACNYGQSNSLGSVTDYDIIVVGGKRYSANQILDKQLIANGPVAIYRGSDFTKPYSVVKSGAIIGKVYSFIRLNQTTGQIAKSQLLMFYDSTNKPYYVKDDASVDSKFLQDQGALTVAEETKIEADEKYKNENPIMYYLKKVGLPVLLVGGGVYLAGTLGKEFIKSKVSKTAAEPKPALAGTKRKRKK